LEVKNKLFVTFAKIQFYKMKKYSLLAMFLIFNFFTFSQTYKSTYVIQSKMDLETKYENRVIKISDSEISITNFVEGIEPLYLIVNKIETKEHLFDGLCKTYYCTTKDKDFINGYQKAIVYKTSTQVKLALFADEMTVYNYNFSIL
jgi:hypothetical protein